MSVRSPSFGGVGQTSAGRDRKPYRCAECGWEATKWVGRCGECQAWGTVEERAAAGRGGRTVPGAVTEAARPITHVDALASSALGSGVGELDRVLGGGVVPGAALLLAGEPGVGKSTLLLAVAARWALSGRRTLYVTGEESTAQVRLRAERTGAMHPELYLAAETDLSAVLTHVEQVRPSLLVVDSVHAIGSPLVDGVPGGVTQVREVAASLVQVPSDAESRCCWSVTSQRTVLWPGHGCSSTWSTSCWHSRGTAPPGCGSCELPRTATAR